MRHEKGMAERGRSNQPRRGGGRAAAARLREILAVHYPAYIEPAADARIRERFPIALPREAMRPS